MHNPAPACIWSLAPGFWTQTQPTDRSKTKPRKANLVSAPLLNEIRPAAGRLGLSSHRWRSAIEFDGLASEGELFQKRCTTSKNIRNQWHQHYRQMARYLG